MAPKATGSGLKKKVAGQPAWAWLAEVGGAIGVYIILKMRSASSAAADGTDTSAVGGTTIPDDSSTSTPVTYSTFAGWEEAALAAMVGPTYSSTQAFNDINSWINGSCVSSAGYTAIGNFITTAGLPPGFGSDLPALSVCAGSTNLGTLPGDDISSTDPTALAGLLSAAEPTAEGTSPPPSVAASATASQIDALVTAFASQAAQTATNNQNAGQNATQAVNNANASTLPALTESQVSALLAANPSSPGFVNGIYQGPTIMTQPVGPGANAL